MFIPKMMSSVNKMTPFDQLFGPQLGHVVVRAAQAESVGRLHAGGGSGGEGQQILGGEGMASGFGENDGKL
jgi:hypothetical protein